MGRSRYRITEPEKPHFLTCTVLDWLPLFTRSETVEIILDSWQYLRRHDRLQLYGYVVLENHLHFIAQAERLDDCVKRFKSYTARRIIDHLIERRVERLLSRLHFGKQAHKTDREYQLWQEGSHPELILNEAMMREKLDYIHYNPVKRGYVEKPEYWRYSSAANYAGLGGLMPVDRWY
jgi:REP element-mobilizing transposase RayT